MGIGISTRVKGFLNNISMHTKLLISFFILILIPLLILTTFTYSKVSNTMEDTMLRTSRNSLLQSVSYLEDKFDNILNISDIIYFNTTLQNVINAKAEPYDEDLIQQFADQKNLFNLLDQLEGSPDIFHIRLYMRNIPGYYYDNINFTIFEDAEARSWYKRLRTLEPVINILPPEYFTDEDNGGEKVIALTRRMNIKKFNVTDALIRVDIRESLIRSIVSQANISKTGLSYIINDRGEIITASGILSLLENKGLRKAIENAVLKEISGIVAYGQDSYLTIQKNITHTNWRFITVIPYSEIRSAGQSIRFYMLLVMLIAGIISYVIALFITRSSTKRLRDLAGKIKNVTEGDFNVKINEYSRDEIGQLAYDFNFMVKEMSGMIDERYETGKRIKSLELKSLQSQINPHFLYNSLDMINWSAILGGNNDIVEMVQSLSRFYKIGLSKGMDIISIENELEHVKAYVSIQNLRFNNQITLETDIYEEVLHFGILKITLQPIVENAIQHGILRKAERSGAIIISAKHIHDDIIIKIKDDGIGMTADVIDRLLTSDSNDEFHGFGIKNINERIKLQFGSKYGLHFESEPNIGTTVTITIPTISL